MYTDFSSCCLANLSPKSGQVWANTLNFIWGMIINRAKQMRIKWISPLGGSHMFMGGNITLDTTSAKIQHEEI